MISKALRLATLFGLVAVAAASGQSAASGQLRPGARFVGMWFGGSWSKKIGPAFSSIPTQPYAILAARSEYVLEARGPVAVSFFVEAMPAIVVGEVPHYHVVESWQPPNGPMRRRKVWDTRAPVYGFGITPVGMQLYTTLSPRIRAFLNASGGVAWFTRDMPVPDSKQTNFLGDLGGGLRIARGSGALLMGLKFHHMSNGNQGHQNPGIDGNVLYAGWVRAR
jgi:hypothetical protein